MAARSENLYNFAFGFMKPGMKTNRGTCRKIAGAVLLVAAGLLVWRLWLPSESVMRRSTALIEHASAYQLKIDGDSVMSFAPDTTYTPAVWINRLWLLPSCLGRLASTPYERKTEIPEDDFSPRLRAWLTRELAANDSVLGGLERQQRELRYYLRVHGVQDEGYTEIYRYALRINTSIDSLRHVDSLLQKALIRRNAEVRLTTRHAVVYRTRGRLRRETVDWTNRGEGDSYMRFRTRSRIKPFTAAAVSLWPWLRSVKEQYFLERYAEDGFKACRKPQITSLLAVKSDASNGFQQNPYTGYGIRYAKEGIEYAGYFKNGKREGAGLCVDSSGRRTHGLFADDTLYYGTRTDATGTYSGDMNRHGTPTGHGIFINPDGIRYEGKWTEGQRSGFGFAIGPASLLHAGEWQHDVYRGERLIYTSERIYGIDISRFQHDIGRKHYPIEWDRLRITQLGTLSRKRVRGKVDYPVSFLYIKSTEGTTVLNKYYADDYRQARKRGIPVGTYHFFSTTSPAKKQAEWFLKNSKVQKGDFPPVLDVEPLPSQIRKMGGEEALWTGVRTWLKAIEEGTGKKPVLYISQMFVNNHLPYAHDIKRDYHVWIARYGEYKPDVRLVYWQLSPDGRVDGIRGEVDINVFNGYRKEFNKFAEGCQ